ncbi:DUF3221 domain-containing protein [Rossellomorea aquimaris]|uniref:DUF3221 domain-containing protein n=1 Tax=Rossellomorea aquimaris TaxID=189382 RepID=UPI0007D091E0|nr:DUF3221 domain-containing protein [Rossellomorea aquimaris]
MEKNFIILFLICFSLVGCSSKEEVKGQFDIKGNIVGINEKENRILVVDADKGETWVVLPENADIKNYQEGQEVVIWVDDGIDTSAPTSAKALNIEITSLNP